MRGASYDTSRIDGKSGMRRDWQAGICQAVDEQAEDAVRYLAEFVRVPSVGGTEVENSLQSQLADLFDSIGLDTDHWPVPLDALTDEPQFPGMEVERAEAWGLVGRRKGSGDGRSLMLNAHIDVVPPGDLGSWADRNPFAGRITDGMVYGRGACDMKGGLVSALLAVRALQQLDVPLGGDLLFASVQGEEDGGMGSYAAIRRGWHADTCVIPEPTGLDLVPANAGSLTFRLLVPGRATHAARRMSGVSAVEKFWPIFRALRKLEDRRNRNPDPLASRWQLPYPISIGSVRSGDWASTVPDLLVAEGRLGVILDEPVERARAEFEQAVAEASAGDPWLRARPVEVQWWGGTFESGRLSADSDLLERVRKAHADATGGSVQQIWAAPYGSDLRLMTNLADTPTLHYGPGDAALAHAPNEAVPVSEVLTCARALALLALDVCTVVA